MKPNIQYSIEFLRGVLAITVAICHFYLSKVDNIHLELISSLSVEIFFVISGFVLAPQIIKIFETNLAENFRIFIIRRFLRTLPAYFFFLSLISLLLGKFLSQDFFKLFFFVQNFSQINLQNDYYPIAWSLSVEEWFYLFFIPILLIFRSIFRFNNIFKFIILWFVFFYILKFAYFSLNSFDWGEDIRRVTIFRLDSIVIGIIFYLFKDLFLKILKNYKYFFFILIIIFYYFIFFNISTKNIFIVQMIFLSISLFSIIILGFFIKSEEIFIKNFSSFSYFIGKISYSIYLSHMLLIVIIRSKSDFEINILYYLSSVFLLSFISRKLVEEPFLKNRPRFKF